LSWCSNFVYTGLGLIRSVAFVFDVLAQHLDGL
jgi:hypothetical protein